MLKGKELRLAKAKYTRAELNEWYKVFDGNELIAYGRLEDVIYYGDSYRYEKM